MELPRILPSRSESQRASSRLYPARDPRRHLLRRKERLRLATLAARLPSVENRLPLLSVLAFGRDVGEDALGPAQAHAGTPREGPSAQRGHRGFPVDQDHGRGRKRAWLRRCQEDQREEAPFTGGYAGVGARSEGP